jgi:hypothetical protein
MYNVFTYKSIAFLRIWHILYSKILYHMHLRLRTVAAVYDRRS